MVKTRIFFVTDVHGSEKCFRKFVNAGKFYNADVLILGGDITGKAIVPLVIQSDGSRRCNYGGKDYVLKSREEVDTMVTSIKDSGYYPHFADPHEVEELQAKPELVNQLFKKVMKQSVEGWMRLAEARLKDTGISCYISPGNDDVFEIDEALNSSDYVINPEERTLNIDGEHEMITLGYANHTPWNSPREADEEALEVKIEKMAEKVNDIRSTLFNLHVPPIDTVIDQAPKLDETLKPILSGGEPVMISAGSAAVRRTIEKFQPLVGIHGHIHESRGIAKIGRTVCFNPGSEYNSGVLRGVLCDLKGSEISSYTLTTG